MKAKQTANPTYEYTWVPAANTYHIYRITDGRVILTADTVRSARELTARMNELAVSFIAASVDHRS